MTPTLSKQLWMALCSAVIVMAEASTQSFGQVPSVSSPQCAALAGSLNRYVKDNISYLSDPDRRELQTFNQWLRSGCQTTISLVSRPEVRSAVVAVRSMANSELALKALPPVGAQAVGLTVPSLAEALSWYQADADRGDALAMNALGLVYRGDAGHPPDYPKARTLFERAINAKLPRAYANLGDMFRSGTAGERNLRKAWDNYHLGLEAGDQRAVVGLQQLVDNSPNITAAECLAIAQDPSTRRFAVAELRGHSPDAELLKSADQLRRVSSDRFFLHVSNGACTNRVNVFLVLEKECVQARGAQSCRRTDVAQLRATDLFCRCSDLLQPRSR